MLPSLENLKLSSETVPTDAAGISTYVLPTVDQLKMLYNNIQKKRHKLKAPRVGDFRILKQQGRVLKKVDGVYVVYKPELFTKRFFEYADRLIGHDNTLGCDLTAFKEQEDGSMVRYECMDRKSGMNVRQWLLCVKNAKERKDEADKELERMSLSTEIVKKDRFDGQLREAMQASYCFDVIRGSPIAKVDPFVHAYYEHRLNEFAKIKVGDRSDDRRKETEQLLMYMVDKPAFEGMSAEQLTELYLVIANLIKDIRPFLNKVPDAALLGKILVIMREVREADEVYELLSAASIIKVHSTSIGIALTSVKTSLIAAAPFVIPFVGTLTVVACYKLSHHLLHRMEHYIFGEVEVPANSVFDEVGGEMLQMRDIKHASI